MSRSVIHEIRSRDTVAEHDPLAQVVCTLYTFLGESRNVDANVKGLHDEALALSRISEAIQKAWTGNARVVEVCAKNDKELWSSVKISLDDCLATVARLSEQLNQLEERNILERGFFKKAVRTARLNMRTKDIDQYRRQIHSHCNVMQGGLIMIQM